MQDRDFKGVWFPKEIWLNKELDMIEKALLIEIDSLDNEEHCFASNDYFAEFLGVSASKVTRSIKKLKDLGYIEEVGFDGRTRKLRVVKLTSLNKQSDYHNNIASNIDKLDNTNVLSTEKSEVVEDSNSFLTYEVKTDTTKKKSAKPNLFNSCMLEIDQFTEDEDIRKLLKEFFDMRVANKDKPFSAKSFKGILNKLRTLTSSKKEACKIIQQAIDRCYLTFYPLSKPKYTNPELIEQSTKVYVTDEEYEEAIELGEKF